MAVFLGTVVTTATFWAVLGPGSRVDNGGDYAAFYEPVARSILEHGRPLYSDGSPGTRYPPGYPLVLAFLFWLARTTGLSELVFLQGFALVGTAASGVWLFLLARTVWPGWSALATPLIWASCPLVLWISAIETSEVAFFAVFYSACYCFWIAVRHERPSPRRYFLVGVLIGCAMLIRPIVIAGGVLMAGFLWYALRHTASRRMRMVAASMLLAGNLAVVVPWEVWVYQQTGRVILLSDGGVASIRDGLTYATNLKGFRSGVPVPSDVEAVMRGLQAGYDELRTFGDIARALGEQIDTKPMGVVKLVLLKAARSWYGTDSHRLEAQVMAVQSVYLVLIAVGAAIAWRLGRPSMLLLLFVGLFTVYLWAMTVVVLSIARYTLPALGLLFVLIPGTVLVTQRALISRWERERLS